MTQLDFQSLWVAPLPSVAELQQRYLQFNALYFNRALPTVTIRWSARMRIAGTCDRRRRIITLSRAYHTHFPDDIDDTLKHEMIHLRHPDHGADFRREAVRIGCGLHCRDYPGLHPRARHIYICPECHTLFHRRKKERLYCGRCSRHRPDPRFLLVLQSGVTTQSRRPVLISQRAPGSRTGIRRWRGRRDRFSGELF